MSYTKYFPIDVLTLMRTSSGILTSLTKFMDLCRKLSNQDVNGNESVSFMHALINIQEILS